MQPALDLREHHLDRVQVRALREVVGGRNHSSAPAASMSCRACFGLEKLSITTMSPGPTPAPAPPRQTPRTHPRSGPRVNRTPPPTRKHWIKIRLGGQHNGLRGRHADPVVTAARQHLTVRQRHRRRDRTRFSARRRTSRSSRRWPGRRATRIKSRANAAPSIARFATSSHVVVR